MIAALWNSFPRMMEENINGLLEVAPPNAIKAFQLYCICKNRELWRGDLAAFASRLGEFYARGASERHKSQFDVYLQRPLDHASFAQFRLDFRTAAISEESILDIASWAHNLIRVGKKITTAFASLDVLAKALRRLTNPLPTEKAENLEFRDFCQVWQRTVTTLFGAKHDAELAELITELRWLDEEQKRAERQITAPRPLLPTVSASESAWLGAVLYAARANHPAPPFAEEAQASNASKLIQELERVRLLYMKSKESRLPEIVKNRERIRLTLIERCEALLGLRKADAA